MMNDREGKAPGRKQGAYNVGSITGRIDALTKGDVMLMPHDSKTAVQCRNAVKTIVSNKPKARFEVAMLDAYDAAGEWRLKLIKVEREK